MACFWRMRSVILCKLLVFFFPHNDSQGSSSQTCGHPEQTRPRPLFLAQCWDLRSPTASIPSHLPPALFLEQNENSFAFFSNYKNMTCSC